MNCPVCGEPGADDQPVGPAVTVFCCPSCVATVLRTFAGHAEPPRRPRPSAPAPGPGWTPRPA